MQNSEPSVEHDKPDGNLFPCSLILQERLRQARTSFNLALSMSVATTLIVIVGGCLLLLGKVSESVVTSTGSITSTLYCFKLAKDANDRLDKLISQLNSEM